MIAIATGFDALDKKIEELFRANGINDLQIVNYREFLIQQPFETIIMSKNLIGQVELEYLVLSLRERNERIIYLTNDLVFKTPSTIKKAKRGRASLPKIRMKSYSLPVNP